MASFDEQRMRQAAIEAAARAYCPYSRFPVGASVLTKSGEVFGGCNVENAAYGASICAERNAVVQAISAGAREISGILIYTPTAAPTTPCGTCRQVLNEFGVDMVVTCICDGPERIETTLKALLPRAFGPADLSQVHRGNSDGGQR